MLSPTKSTKRAMFSSRAPAWVSRPSTSTPWRATSAIWALARAAATIDWYQASASAA
jgi:hypothetical protein